MKFECTGIHHLSQDNNPMSHVVPMQSIHPRRSPLPCSIAHIPCAMLVTSLADSAVFGYLENRFSDCLKKYEQWCGQRYGSVYMNCLMERFVMDVCSEVGIEFGHCSIVPGAVDGMVITYKQVCSWAGVPPTMFMSLRSYFNSILMSRHPLWGPRGVFGKL